MDNSNLPANASQGERMIAAASGDPVLPAGDNVTNRAPFTIAQGERLIEALENGGGGGDAGILTVEVTATVDPETYLETFTTNYTGAEIISAIKSGKIISLYYANMDRFYSVIRYDEYQNSVNFLSLTGDMLDDSSYIPKVQYNFALVDANGNAYLSEYGQPQILVSNVIEDITEETQFDSNPPSTYAVYNYVQTAIGDAIGGSY